MSAPEGSKMGDRNESEGSYSSDSSSSSSDSSSDSSDGSEEVLEPVTLQGRTLHLPQDLCEDYAVFKEFFSMDTWNSLSDENKERLKQFLPKFTDNEEEETDKTIKMLFNFEPFHFTSPLGDFFNNLRQGNYRPDIANMRNFLKRARTEQQRHRKTAYYAKLLPELLISRERLLTAAKGLPPGPIPYIPNPPQKQSSKDSYKSIFLRTKQRYFEELAAIRSEFGGEESDDDNYPDGPPDIGGKRKKVAAGQSTGESNISGTLGARDPSNPTSLECLKNVLAIHRMRRQYRDNHPELDTSGISLDDIKQRVALVNGAKKLMFGGQKGDAPVQKLKRGPKPKTGVETAGKQSRPPDKGGKKKEDPIITQETVENRPLLPNIKIKCEQEESDSESSSFVDPVTSPKPTRRSEQVEIKEEIVDPRYNVPNINYNEPSLESMIKQEPLDQSLAQNAGRVVQPVPIKLEDLDGIDMMDLPVEIADDCGEVLVNTSDTAEEQVLDPDEALAETTHANFLSLVRGLFPARAAHRAPKQQLHARLAAVMKSPIAPLNTWYSLADDWCSELDSALSFLSGERGPHPEDFVPYLQYMPETQMYQWIGAGRDCDAILGRLCERWLNAAIPAPLPTEPPPPKYPTSWVVRPPSTAEIIDFRAQERKRFASAAKPFTYVQYGYRSVVGPCTRASTSCAGHSSLLVVERPRHAHLMALVRDAVARLPNGEGSRHDVVTLLKMSQWIAPCTDMALLTAVSSTLDKLHSAKRDPMVKYDQKTAIWTYLHRNRSEEDWVRTTGCRSRAPKAAAATKATPTPSPVPAAATLPAPAPGPAPVPIMHPSPPHAMEMEVASIEEVVDNGSDTDVDVDDSSSPSGLQQLSSAQLLMQAARTHPTNPVPTPKSKGKLVAVSPPKPKPTKQIKPLLPPPKPINKIPTPSPPTKQNIVIPKIPVKPPTPKPTPKPTIPSPKTNLMAQAAKQASLMAQSAKQASVIAQLTKQIPPKQNLVSKQVSVVKQQSQSPKSANLKQVTVTKTIQLVKQEQSPKQEVPKISVVKPAPTVVPAPHKSPLMKQRPLQKPVEITTVATPPTLRDLPQPLVVTPPGGASGAAGASAVGAGVGKVLPTRSLLIRASAAPAAASTVSTASSSTLTPPHSQATTGQRRGIVRVLTPTTPTGGKSLISPRALMQQGTPTTKKRVIAPETSSVTAVAQSASNLTTVVSSVPTAVTASSTRTVQLAGGRTVQLAANQTVHLPGGQAVQLTSGHTLQLSSLQLPTHSVRLPSGQTVQLASPQAIRAVSTAKTSSPRPQQTVSSPTIKTPQNSVQIPISSVQIAGQTVQIAGQTVQLAGQSVQLTGHTVKLPSGQSVQVASPSVIPSQSVQLPSGQTVQLASGNMQTVQLGQNILNQTSGVQLTGQTVQLGGQTVQLSGQTLQLGGQTVQLSSGQTIQLASGQTVQLSSQQPKAVAHVARTPSGEKTAQPIVAKLLTNAQGQMISLEGGAGGAGAGGARTLQMSGVRVVPPRAPRPLLLATKPHNIYLQQSDGTAIRVTSTGGASTSQTIVLSNIGGQTVTSSVNTPPVLKLQQVNTLQQVKLPHGIKLQQASPSVSVASPGVRSVVMDAQQLKLVGGRHVLARILRPAPPPLPPSQPPPQ